MKKTELAIIGSGPAGYQAALIASQKGIKTTLIEKGSIGGVCLNWGCIPTKFFLNISEKYREFQAFKNRISHEPNPVLDYGALKKDKDNLVKSLGSGIKFLLDKRGVDTEFAQAEIVSENEIVLKSEQSKQSLKAENIIIATGSSAKSIEGIRFDNKKIFSSDSIVNIDYIPKSIVIIGAGAVGVEFASHFARLGSRVYLIEIMDDILPSIEPEVSGVLKAALVKLGIEVYTSSKIIELKQEQDSLAATLSDKSVVFADSMLIAASRTPNTSGLLQDLKLTDQRGFISVNDKMRTNIGNIYAAGDVCGGLMLAHKAGYQARVAVLNISGEDVKADYSCIPICIYTSPEIASVGLKETEAEEMGFDIKVAKFPFRALGKARAIGRVDGFVKLIADRKSKVLLGGHLVGPLVTEFITELTMAIKFRIPYSKLIDLVHPHPTLQESIQEALCILNDEPLHQL